MHEFQRDTILYEKSISSTSSKYTDLSSFMWPLNKNYSVVYYLFFFFFLIIVTSMDVQYGEAVLAQAAPVPAPGLCPGRRVWHTLSTNHKLCSTASVTWVSSLKVQKYQLPLLLGYSIAWHEANPKLSV